MEKFSAEAFFEIANYLGRFRHVEIKEDAPLRMTSALVASWLPGLQKRCEDIGLRQSAKYVKRILGEVGSGKVNLSEFRSRMVPELEHRIQDEMEDELFLHVPSRDSEFFGQPELFGQEVATAFPSASQNIEEAGNCYALERYTACMFHLQGAMQIALEALGNAIGVPATENRTWDAILKKIDPELTKKYTDKSPYFQQNETFCGEAAALLRSVKIAWRNPTMHVDKTYDKAKTLEVLNAVMGLMRHLATKLHE